MSDAFPYIDRYFKDELSLEEKKAFERRCITDPAFVRMVAFYISLQEHSQEQWADRKKQQFAQLEEKTIPLQQEAYFAGSSSGGRPNQEEAKVRNIKSWIRLAVAAAVLGVLAVGVTWYVQNTKEDAAVALNDKQAGNTKNSNVLDTPAAPQNRGVDTTTKQEDKKPKPPGKRFDPGEQQQLFARNFTPDDAPGETVAFLEEAFEPYQRGDYQQASEEYEEALAVVKDFTTRTPGDQQEEAEKKRILFYAHYYNVISYLAAGKASKAIEELKAIKESPDQYWHSKRQWYLALAYLKRGEVAKAKALLAEVAAGKQAKEYRQKAIKLSRELQEESIK